MSLMLALLLAQVGPSVSPGAGGALPQAPLEIPRKAKLGEPVAVPAAPLTRLDQCLAMARTAPLDALEEADAWLELVKGATIADPAQCKALALSALERWSEAEAAFLMGRDALPANEQRRRAEFGAGAAIAAEEAGALDRALAHFDAARAAATASGNPALAGRIARDRANPLFKLDRRAEATTALAEARAALPNDAATWLISARLSRRLDRISEAQAQIERAAALDPRDPEIGVEAGLIALLDGRDEAARKSWRSVLAMAPASEAAKRAQGYLDQLGPEPPSSGR